MHDFEFWEKTAAKIIGVGEDTTNKRWEEGGEGEEGEADKRMEPGLEHPGKTCTRTGTSGG